MRQSVIAIIFIIKRFLYINTLPNWIVLIICETCMIRNRQLSSCAACLTWTVCWILSFYYLCLMLVCTMIRLKCWNCRDKHKIISTLNLWIRRSQRSSFQKKLSHLWIHQWICFLVERTTLASSLLNNWLSMLILGSLHIV